MKLILSQVVGQPSDEVWSQVMVLGSSATDIDTSAMEQGSLVMSMTVRSEEEAVSKGSEVMGWFENKFVELGEDVSADGFYEWLKGASFENVDLVGFYVKKKSVLVFGYGGGRVVLRRKGKTGLVFQAKKNEWMLREGAFAEGDVWLVGTEGLVGQMAKDLIEQMLDTKDVAAAGQDLAAIVHSGDDSADAAGVFIGVEEGEEDEVEKMEEEKKERKRRSPAVYLKNRTKKQKTALSVGLVLLVMLLMSIGLGWQKRQNMMYEERFNEVMGQVNEYVQTAEKVKLDNPLQAKQAVVEARGMIEQSRDEFEDREDYSKSLEEKLLELDALYAEVSGEASVGEVPVWYELSLIREGMYGVGMDFTGGQVFVLDGALGVVGEVVIEGKEGSLVAGGDLLGEAKAFDVSGVRSVIFGEKGVVEANLKTKTTDVMVEPEDEWGSIKSVGMFSGNVYLLDVGKSEIWRYPAITAGVGDRQRWFGASFTPDVSDGVDMSIDGDIWVMHRSGEISRFRQGADEPFEISGLDNPISEGVAIFTNEDMESVFVLDRGNTRIVSFAKSGEYEKQYGWEGLAAAEDLVVDEVSGVMYVLVGSTIYSINM